MTTVVGSFGTSRCWRGLADALDARQTAGRCIEGTRERRFECPVLPLQSMAIVLNSTLKIGRARMESTCKPLSEAW